jgi:hypothetical protein
MKKLKTYFNHKKEFHYFSKIRYAQGIGDVCAAILHSKLIGPITYLVTGKLEPCNTCQNRRTALNLLLPVPIWKIFFKSEDAYNEKLNKEFEKFQNNIKPKFIEDPIVSVDSLTETEKETSIVKETVDIIEDKKEITESVVDDYYKDYFLMAENRTEHETLLIVNKIYKKL